MRKQSNFTFLGLIFFWSSSLTQSAPHECTNDLDCSLNVCYVTDITTDLDPCNPTPRHINVLVTYEIMLPDYLKTYIRCRVCARQWH